jgi:phosphate/phosphite/phosphonate ABC transporter binding protein
MTQPPRDLPFLVFGYAAPEATDEAKQTMTDLATRIGARAGVDIAVTALPSYERVTQLVHKGNLDLAWVSPIPFIALQRSGSVVPLVAPFRGGMHYHGALVTAAGADFQGLAGLAGKRVAWVDRYSAAGFVVARIELAKAGLDPRTAFASQRLYGSHEAAVRAVVEGRADVAATFVRLAPNGAVIQGPWTHMPGVEEKLRIFATFGEIPPDVIAARASLDPAVRDRVEEAFLSLGSDVAGRALLGKVFGAEELFKVDLERYEALRNAAVEAVQEHLLDVEEDMEPELVFDPNADHTLKMKAQP